MTDISTRDDIEMLMADFYNTLLADDSINYIFTDVARINLELHLPRIVDFWEQNILGSGSYRANVLKIHLDLNEQITLDATHFTT